MTAISPIAGKSLALVFLAAIGFPGSAFGANELQCFFQSRHICDASGCKNGDPKASYVLLSPDTDQYARCDGKTPCDWYPMEITKSGMFLNIDFSTGVQGAKISQNGDVFIETLSIMDKVIISYGSCENRP